MDPNGGKCSLCCSCAYHGHLESNCISHLRHFVIPFGCHLDFDSLFGECLLCFWLLSLGFALVLSAAAVDC